MAGVMSLQGLCVAMFTDQYDPSTLLQFLTLFPNEAMAPIIRGFLLYYGLPTSEEAEEEEVGDGGIPDGQDDAEDEDPYALVLVSDVGFFSLLRCTYLVRARIASRITRNPYSAIEF